MRHISKFIKTLGLAACTGLLTTSCDVELMPLNEVVLENYWTDKTDVENVLTSCYTAMQSGTWMERVLVWGEVRSDNIAEGANVPSGIQNIIKGNLVYTNSVCTWGSIYNVINYCNTLIYYAPQVAEKDPNLTPSDLNSYVAQAKGIRALNYFYLVRSFKDVPFSLDPSIDDTQDYVLAATPGTQILDTLIQDLEACKDQAPVRYTTQTSSTTLYSKNSGRMTRVGIYALLADMYLWRASDADLDVATQQYYYRKCVECADFVLDFKKQDYDDDVDGTLKSRMDTRVYSNYGYPLLAESSAGSSSQTSAYEDIFGDGNSWESLFEITYPNSTSTSDTKNRTLSYYYGGKDADGNNIQYVSANTNLMSTALTGSNRTYSDQSLFSVCTDIRSLSGFHYNENGTYPIYKYVVSSFSGTSDLGTITNSNWAAGTSTAETRSYLGSYANWIVYRLTDVMLMRAEAELQLANILDQNASSTEDEDTTATSSSKSRRAAAVDGSSLSTAQEYYDDAFNLILAVYTRSNYNASTTASFYPQRSSYTNYTDFMTLLENERHREFLFEGKRYYDLVRRARREGNTSHFASAISAKFTEASNAVLIKMAMMDFMYMPYAKREMDVNSKLVQNPAYDDQDKSNLQ